MKSLAGWFERGSNMALVLPACQQAVLPCYGLGFLADKRRANIEAAAWKDTQCELDVRRIRDREDSACKPVSSPARFDVGECAVVMRKHVKRDLAATMIFSGATG